MLRELFTPNIQHIKSIHTDGTDAPIRLCRKTGDEQKRKQRVLGVHTAKTAGVSTAAHFARKARTTTFERTFAPQSLFLSANAGRGTTERGTRRNQTQGETRLNAGGRSLTSIGTVMKICR